jgi:transcriptional regulator with XRE-family HTH domain
MHTNPKPTAIDHPTAATLTAWRERMGYSQRDACRELGCSRGAWANWENGAHEIPRYIGLALAALALGMNNAGDASLPDAA